MEGHTTLPGPRVLPPGTPEFVSPEAYRFLQEHFEEEVRYQPGVADEVWAFGVTLYWLLTDELPFVEWWTASSSTIRGSGGWAARGGEVW